MYDITKLLRLLPRIDQATPGLKVLLHINRKYTQILNLNCHSKYQENFLKVILHPTSA